MSKMSAHSRRTFLKSSAAAAAAVGASKFTVGTAFAKTAEWRDGMQINPAIDNLRVAMVRDRGMVVNDIPASWDFGVVNENIVDAAVEANMDAMARYLADKSSSDEAWDTIFQKPPSKEWADVRVALKVNCIHPPQMIKLALINKVCDELRRLGVPYANMVVWDGCHNAWGSNKYEPFRLGNGLREDVDVSNRNSLLGGMSSTPVPAPWGGGSADCTADLANGNVDILVNFAINKGHGDSRGKLTLSMKNHFGTFSPQPGHDGGSENQFNYLIGINKSSAILGGEVPRQQLVVMDSIYAMNHGPTGNPPNAAPYVLLMGTFGPAVDYATAKIIREEEMGASHTAYLEEFLPQFGYTTQERDDFIAKTPEENGGLGVQLVSADAPVHTRIPPAEGRFIHITAGHFESIAVRIPFPAGDKIRSADVFTPGGRLVRHIPPQNIGGRGVSWDGRDESGRFVRRGAYVVRLTGRLQSGSGKIILK